MPTKTVTVETATEAGVRIDRYVADVLGLFSRSQTRVRNLQAAVNGRSARLSHRVRSGDRLTLSYTEPQSTSVRPEPVTLAVLYEDDEVVVVDKPVGMVVHPAKGNYSGTLVQGLLWHLGARDEEIGPVGRPGVVHRLDKDTSGVIILAKNPEVQRRLALQFKERSTGKRYLAVVKGTPSREEGRIEGFIARDRRNRKRFALSAHGKWSETNYRVLWRQDGFAFLSLYPKTGRTHQLRVHLASIGHPILGDPVYARRDSRFPDVKLMLHAYRLEIQLPASRQKRVFRAPLPERFKRVLTELAHGTSEH